LSKSKERQAGTSISAEGYGPPIPDGIWLIDTPEKKLLLAIIERAIRDVMRKARGLSLSKSGKVKDLKRKTYEHEIERAVILDADKFLESDNKRDWGVLWMLEHLAIDPIGVHKQIAQIVQEIKGGKEIMEWKNKRRVIAD
jgi:hypothetical protein